MRLDKFLHQYLEADFSLIPLRPKSKTPAIAWSQFQQRQASEAEVLSWIEQSPELNIGIVTGAISGIVVLDVDGPEGEEHIKSFGEIPRTPTVRTGKGKHYYFKHPGFDVANRTGMLPKVDVRGHGGYIVAPPSVHENGRTYEWDVDLNTPLAEMPSWLVVLLTKPVCNSATASVTAAMSRSVKLEVDGILGKLALSEIGRRNDDLNKSAFLLGQYVGSGALEAGWCIQSLKTIAENIGLTPTETETTIESGLAAGMKEPKETEDVFEILDSIPSVIDRPIRLIEKQAYGVAWLPVAVRGNPQDRQIIPVVFDDRGSFYSEFDIPGSKHISELEVELDLSFEISEAKRLSPVGFKRFISGNRPNASEVFDRTVKSIDAFVSFENSVHDQQSMCELVACYTVGTYFSEAFDVVGYLWPNGERASGKTQLLNTVTTLAYLGKTVTAGSSFASIRDEAHYGATIAFDDCEDVKGMDTNKRELLLAGNTRGTVITHKELIGDVWRTKTINSFAPRFFSAISLPDAVLDSRTIRLPMVASADKNKTRRSPSRKQDWPCDTQTLIDDLWISGVSNLQRVSECDQEAASFSPLTGRSHDIFRMPLAIALWLEMDHGVRGLFDRISSIADGHQGMKLDASGHDLVSLILMTVSELLGSSTQPFLTVPTKQIADLLREIGHREEVAEVMDFCSNVQRVGRMLSSLGFKRDNSHGRARSWKLEHRTLQQIAQSRGIKLPTIETVSGAEGAPKLVPVPVD